MIQSKHLKDSITLLSKLSFLLTKSDLSLEDKLQDVVLIIAQALGVKKCSLVLKTTDNGFKIVASTGLDVSKEKLQHIDPVKDSKIIRYVIENQEPIVVKTHEDMLKYDLKPKKNYKITSFISAPLIVPGGKFLGVINLTETLSNKPFTDIQSKTILILSNQIAITIENTKLSQQILQDTLIREQLKIAQRVQNSLVPEKYPDKIVDSYGFTIPTFQVGGDYFDISEISEDEVAFILADVSGKGIPASLIMTSFRSYWRALIKTTKSPKKIFEKLNQMLFNDLEKENLFLTCFYGIYNKKKHTLLFGNAGNEFPIFYNSFKSKFTIMNKNNTILGVFPNTKYNTYSKDIQKGDVIFVFSDGVTDFQYLREIDSIKIIKDIYLKNSNKSIKIIVSKIKETLLQKIEGRHSDDLTLIALRF